ncbi:uncharacterized protein PGTG_17932 [Puccinia graminis f. sp. tritici CRL 75-36-700-3]|uniref:Integrase catalytic domain-containing protein n=1 Tax=Puccinia graminis f. sp. tritici (strain CRL 75-36-700-3 / race SCCL) TaxID=418459 RepID=E3L5T0_PUCGT|nr:uncharacterized protein PGTG_17932 [Puccinia graminis f. sp. tritici CRL 75-36-700-3]EFP91905.1 hypothetical protein PGTG_17932 [Puccinia graminis f. sp. tritici CRL 75-36-700-3]
MQVRLYKETGVEVSVRTVQRYMKKLGVKLLQNDLLDGKVTINRVLEAITNARENLLQNNAGYRRMRMILMRHYNIRVPRQNFYYALKQIDPDGMALRLRQACKRHIYRTLGSNHIWACDEHDKLKPFGITIYGFIDAWSRKILGMFVHVTNNKQPPPYRLLLSSSCIEGWWITTQCEAARPSGATEELKALLCQAQDSQKVLQKLIPCKELEEFVKGWNPWTIKKELYPSAPKKNDGKKRSSSSKEVKQLYNDPNRWKKVMRGCNTLEAAYRHMAD